METYLAQVCCKYFVGRKDDSLWPHGIIIVDDGHRSTAMWRNILVELLEYIVNNNGTESAALYSSLLYSFFAEKRSVYESDTTAHPITYASGSNIVP